MRNQFKSIIILIILQLVFAISFIILMDIYGIERNLFILNLFFYLFIFIIPAFIYIYKFLGQNPLIYLLITKDFKNGIVKGILIALFIALIFFIKNRFTINFNTDKISVLFGLILAGIFEEIPFRGLYLKELGSRIGFWSANIITSILFALLHMQKLLNGDFISIIMLFIISIWLGYIYEKTKSIWSPIIVHSVYNVLTIIF